MLRRCLVKSNAARPTTSIDVVSLRRYCDADNHTLRDQLRELFKDKIFTPRYVFPSLAAERETAYQRIKTLCNSGLMSVKYFQTEPTKVFTVHEMVGMVNGDLATKMTVQFNLFGGTVLKIGQKHHHDLLVEGIDKFTHVGCFALTELGYGNNAVEMETTATYDEATDEFIVHTPSTKAQKYWITNGAVHAHYAVVFAQLRIKDEEHGVHGFLVPLRDPATMSPLPGVQIQDMGHKIGVNGIDNGKLFFNNVRIPRQNMLMRDSKVEKGGAFTSTIPKRRDRFLKLADQLVSGRICIASMCLGSSKVALFNTVRYSSTRLGVGPSGKSTIPILAYQLQQTQVIPHLADLYALIAGLKHTRQLYADTSLAPNPKESELADVLIRACTIKALVTWHLERVANLCRERCGGQGFLSANRFGEAIAGAHAGMTAEGDNRVLIQKVAKECLDNKAERPKVVRMIFARKLLTAKFLRRLHGANFNIDTATLPQYLAFFKFRELVLKAEVASAIKIARHKGKENVFSCWMGPLASTVQRLGIAVGERYVLASMIQEINNINDNNKDTKELLTKLGELYAMHRIENDLGWMLCQGLLSQEQGLDILERKEQLCAEIGSTSAVALVDAFGIEEHMQWAPISKEWETYNEQSNAVKGELTQENVW